MHYTAQIFNCNNMHCMRCRPVLDIVLHTGRPKIVSHHQIINKSYIKSYWSLLIFNEITVFRQRKVSSYSKPTRLHGIKYSMRDVISNVIVREPCLCDMGYIMQISIIDRHLFARKWHLKTNKCNGRDTTEQYSKT